MNKPRILLVADGRSPITRNWISMLRTLDYSIFLASTYPYQPIERVDKQATIPVGFSALAGGQVGREGKKRGQLGKQLIGMLRPALMRVRAVMAPRLIQTGQRNFIDFISECKPDIVHAMRIPFEGMLSATVPENIPLVVSIWGNDLTLHAKSSRKMGELTQEVLQRADALLADASRDIALAKEMGLREGVPAAVVPGSGGLDLGKINSSAKEAPAILQRYNIPSEKPFVINPRGFRPGSVHQDVFFESIPLVLAQKPEVHFLCPGMRGQPYAEKRVKDLAISHAVNLLPYLDQRELWALYSACNVYVSLSSHDGTPNSFLEAIACGCYPVVGDIASLREWITPGENGSLVDPKNAQAAAEAISGVIGDENLRGYAKRRNRSIIEKLADRKTISKDVNSFYRALL